MRIGRMLAYMFVTGVGLLVLAAVLEKAWPLFLLFPAFGLAIPLVGDRAQDESPASDTPVPQTPPNA
ncbi:MAG: hypothetical protein LC722_05165 [Actinobacteria bacterium]|nr:hypothetical protein [Actinomycetota bacterium]